MSRKEVQEIEAMADDVFRNPESGVVSPATDMAIPAMARAAAVQAVVSGGKGWSVNPGALALIPATNGSMSR